MDYEFLLVIAIILLSTKVLGLLSQKVHMPQVVGALLAGIILGPSVLGLVEESDFLIKVSEIGVIILMFMAGLDTDWEELKKTGIASFVIALVGVIVPLAGGYICYYGFFDGSADPHHFLKAIFVGVVLTATSVSITVETLRELGHLKTKAGTAILGAAIIDDILGIIILTIITSFTDSTVKPSMVFIKIALFFVFLALVGFVLRWFFIKMEKWYGQKRRLAVFALAICFLLSFVAEHFFGVADITGAYFAGLFLCNLSKIRDYLVKRISVLGFLFFSPMFFASIGIKTSLEGLTGSLIVFSLVLLVVAILSKVIGCGLGAKLMGFSNHESLVVGIGMISRGEVALIVAQKGSQAGLISSELFPAIVVVVIVTTLITPVLLKLVLRKKPKTPQPVLAE